MNKKSISNLVNLKAGLALIGAATTEIAKELTTKMLAANASKITLKSAVDYYDPDVEKPQYTEVVLEDVASSSLLAHDTENDEGRALTDLPTDEFLAIIEALPKKFKVA